MSHRGTPRDKPRIGERTSVVTYGLQVRGDGTGILPEGVERLEYGGVW
jgi:hypothetical protein